MFCPRCGEQNELVQGYCRQCGQGLSGVLLALGRSPEQSLEELKAAEKWINAGSATMVIFTLIGVAIMILGLVLKDPSINPIALINVLLGVAIGIPLICAGRAKVKRAARLLSKSDSKSDQASLERAQPTGNLITTGLDQDLRIPVQAR